MSWLRRLTPGAIVGLMVLILTAAVLVLTALDGCGPRPGDWDGGPFAPFDSTITDRESPI